ncbi:hypothetical protein PSEUBRA_003058 [Kalmanozyma brasiliensis GHG001]|uniref:Pep1 n=1 Tax=Kalmanozyma brasiliensis (strain GHG001) TaxID=1365824 RepID=V5ERZ6_KALBG|nr:uncharacterized protein PSEUBRA_003058 [Kalmanozyma brasiliensis GHG001]EST07930.1 hypothetical protein PSEUBRA_003058 [Kalmanozyma brasiliensis GHG001]
MKTTLLTASFVSLASLLFTSLTQVSAGAVPVPDYTVHPLPLASTFYWFSSVEVGVCYSPTARVASIPGALHCTHQEKYDIDNNSWTLPQTCVALKPLGGPLSSAVRDSCKNAKGTFNVITPAGSNAEGGQAYDAIQKGGPGGGGAGAGGDGASTDDSNDAEDSGKKKDGGLLGGLGSMFGM